MDNSRVYSSSAAWRASAMDRARHRSAANSRSHVSATPSSLGGATPCSSHASESVSGLHLDDDATMAPSMRNVRFSDKRLAAMAVDAARAIEWDALKQQQQHLPSARWTRKKLSSDSSSSATTTTTTTAVYTREDPQSFRVLTSVLLQCSVQELRLVFDTRTSEQFSDVMRVLCGRDLLAAEFMHVVGTTNSSSSSSSSSYSTSRSTSNAQSSRVNSVCSAASSRTTSTVSASSSSSADLVVSALLFDKPNIFAHPEQWCFLEYLEDNTNKGRRRDGANSGPSTTKRSFTKTLAALHSSDCVVARSAAPRARHGRDVLAGFLFEEHDDGRSTRVLFTAELFTTGKGSKTGVSDRAARARLLHMARWVDRVALVVRRRRLGIQVLADRHVGRALNTHCACCRRSFRLARRRSCGLCGLSVCDRCSAPEPRETCPDVAARSVITHVRTCDTCIVRVNQCRYAVVDRRALRPARVVADPIADSQPTTTTGAVLAQLLHETMATATDARKRSVLSVIKHLVDQEPSDSRSNSSSSSKRTQSIALTDASTDAEHFAALQSQLNAPALPLADCVLANAETRAYALAFPPDPTAAAAAILIGATEQHRLAMIDAEQLVPFKLSSDVRPNDTDSACDKSPLPSIRNSNAIDLLLHATPELDIICDLAAKELACSGSLITVVGRDALHVVASTLAPLAHRSFPRAHGFCAQTILDAKPLLVPHPEADVRFSAIAPVATMGVRFYCGFPLIAADGDNATVIGSVCCVDHESRALTQSQYTVMTKLAATASRVLQAKAKARQRAQQADASAVAGSKHV